METMMPTTELLRFTTAGSVDDGKSTLIGRLLYDSKSIFEDQYDSIRSTSERRGESGVNLALLTDGLKAEREQGITIDVAYRYFATPQRKFIIADTPGHIQYTRNMVTGASTANVALILIDARRGVVEQTRRHAFIAGLLQIPHLLVCVNKMDLVEFGEARYAEIRADFETLREKLPKQDVSFVPVSALLGDNVVEPSKNMPWYEGATLLQYLERVDIAMDYDFVHARFPVQYVIRPYTDEYHDYRGYAGRVAGGIFRPGQAVKLLPSGLETTIEKIDTADGELEQAFPPQSVTLLLADDMDLSRGDMIVAADAVPEQTQDVEVMLCWFNERPLQVRGKYALRHTTREARCVVKEVVYRLDINTYEEQPDRTDVGMNDIARVKLRTTVPLFVDPYEKNRVTGSLILVDEQTHETVAAGMVI